MPGARVGEGQVQSWACALCDLDREGSLTGVAPACPRPRKAARSWPGRQGEGRAFWAEEPCAQNSGTDAGCLSEPALEWPQLCTGPTECWGLRPGHWCSLREAPPGTALPGLQLQQEVTEGGADPGGSSAGGSDGARPNRWHSQLRRSPGGGGTEGLCACRTGPEHDREEYKVTCGAATEPPRETFGAGSVGHTQWAAPAHLAIGSQRWS